MPPPISPPDDSTGKETPWLPSALRVIGAGLIGRTHIEVLRSGNPDYTLAAVADPSPAAAEEAEQLGYQCYRTLEEMLDKAKPDGAIVAMPNQMHVAIGLACIARKVPIIVEKPIADTVDKRLRPGRGRARRPASPILIGHHRRHNPIMRKAAEIIADGGIGRVVAANALWLSHKPKGYHRSRLAARARRRPGADQRDP